MSIWGPAVVRSAEHSRATAKARTVILQRSGAFGRAALLTGLFAAADLVLRLGSSGNSNPKRWSAQDVGIYALGLLLSQTLWTAFCEIDRRLSSRWANLRRRLLVAISMMVGVTLFLSLGYRSRFDQLPSWQTLRFTLSEPQNAFTLLRSELCWHHGLACLGLSVVFFWVHRFPVRRVPWPRVRWFVVWALLASTNAACVLGVPGFQDPLPADTNVAAAWVQLGIAKLGGARHLVTPLRPTIPPQPERKRPNVLLLLHENLRGDAVFPTVRVHDGLDARRLSPFGSRLPERRGEGFFTFPRARTNSTATESSVPVVLSGLELGGSSNAYGVAHSIWSLGKASHAHTFLFSAQSYRWSHFDEFFFDQNLDLARTSTDIDAVVVNDTGIDDALAVNALISHLSELAHDRTPFVGVMHFSGTHPPFWPGPGMGDLPRAERFPAAVRYVDRQVQRIVLALGELGLDDDTVLLSTSDHGQPFRRPGSKDRLSSFYDETARVPLWIRIPPRWQEERPEWTAALDAWHDRNAENMDVLPTVRDLLGLQDVGALDDGSLPGRSLVRLPPAEDWVISGQSTCAFRAWAGDGFFLVRGSIKLIADNHHDAPQLYDLDADPTEENDLWPDASWRERAMPWVTATILAGEERRAVCKRVRRSCPVRLD